MALRINRVPRGLLSYLDSKNAGQPPQTVAEQISATFRLEDFFFAQQYVDLWGQVAAANTGAVGIALASGFLGVAGGAFRVPPGEIWLVRSVSARVAGALLAGTEYNVSLGYEATDVSGGTRIWHGLGHGLQPTGFSVAGGSPVVNWSGEPFVMVPNDQFGIYITRVTLGTAEPFEYNARAVRLLV